MDSLTEGARNEKGFWTPEATAKPGIIFQNSVKVREWLKAIFGIEGFVIIMLKLVAIAAIVWYFLTPSLEQAATLRPGWILLIYLRNVALLTFFAGRLHLRLYVRRAQGMKYKYTPEWQATKDKKFMFGNQAWDNMFFSLVSGCIFWTAYEVLFLWGWANGIFPRLHFTANGVVNVRNIVIVAAVLFLGVLWYMQAHFYLTHRVIHWKPLFRISHHVHHRNTSPGPWSGLSMHPIEHLIYFSDSAIFLLIPMHPLVVYFILLLRAIGPAGGHAGYHAFVRESRDGKEKPTGGVIPFWPKGGDYMHELHHRYYTVNFGNLGFPLDKLLNTFHDGSPESHQEMLDRRKAKAKRARRRKRAVALEE